MEEKVIVVATDLEESLVKPLTKLKVIKTQPGSSNVIETLKDLKKDIDLMLKLEPDHISTYSLIVEEGTEWDISAEGEENNVIAKLSGDTSLINCAKIIVKKIPT